MEVGKPSGREVPGTARGRRRDVVRRRLLPAALLVTILLLLPAGGTAAAGAAVGHPLLSQLSEAGGEAFVEVSGVAISHASGEVFVVNGESVDVYDAAGKFKTSFGSGVLSGGSVPSVAVDKSNGHVYVADDSADVIDVFKPNGSGGYVLLSRWSGAGTPAGAFGEVTAVAVNAATGLVYAADLERGIVDIFKANPTGPEEALEGKYVSVLTGGAIEAPNGLAVNEATGQIYVADSNAIKIYEAAGKFERKISAKSTPPKEAEFVAVAVEESTGDTYASGEGSVFEFDSTGAYLGTLSTSPPPGSPFGEAFGVAVSSAGKVYVADAGARVVDIFGPGEAVPTVKTLPAPFAKITRTTATLKGTFDPEGAAGTSCHFEYETQGAFQESETYLGQAPCVLKGTTAEAAITGLKAGEPYIYRIVGESEDKLGSYGVPMEFETSEAVTLTTGPVENLEPTSATLTGSLTPEGFATKYHFEYGETTAYGTSIPVPDAETSELGEVLAKADIAGLRPNTTYHYRLIASNEFGTSFGADATFRTPGAPVITSLPTTEIEFTSATIHAKINPEQRATEYHFEYGTSTAYGTSVPIPDGTIPAGATPVEESAALTGLALATTYHFRVVASNAAGQTVGPDQEFTTAPIDSESAREVTSSSAVLLAAINAFKHPTTYHFEYGKTTAYEGGKIPIPDATLEAGEGDRQAFAHVVGLEASTTYHYRIVAVVEGIGTAVGADRTFTTLAPGEGLKLPDGRGWEMVSPSDKHGGLVEPLTGAGAAIQASADGSAFAYVVDGPIVTEPESNRSPEPQQVIATRGSSSWESQEINAPHDAAFGLRAGSPPEYQIFSSDLSLAYIQPFPYGNTALAEPPLAPPLSEAERGHQEKTAYLRANPPVTPAASEAQIYAEALENGVQLGAKNGEGAKPGYLPLVTAANTPAGTQFGGRANFEGNNTFQSDLSLLGATADLTHVVLRSPQVSLSAESTQPGLFEWFENKLEQVSILPNGQPAAETSLSKSPHGEADLGYGTAGKGTVTTHAISSDGSRVIWTYRESEKAVGHLYSRDMVHHATVQVDKAAAGLKEAETGEARFQTASADGSRIFFTDPQRLTADSTAAFAKPDLYLCQLPAPEAPCQLSDLTVESSAGESANVQQQVLGAAEDGSAIYFVATGVLASGAVSGVNNLYAMHEAGGKWTTTLVARLSSEDSPDWFASGNNNSLTSLTARVSPNGRYLAFMSRQRLTGYDNTDVYEEKVNEETVNEKTILHVDEEVFLYDSSAPRVSCVSCNPSGARPTGVLDQPVAGEGIGLVVDAPRTWENGRAGVDPWLAGNIPGWTAISATNSFIQSRYLSDSGRLFFNSADPLVPQAAGVQRKETINGKSVSVGVENVYQYEPQGSGSCATPSGCVSLLSSGASEHESAFMEASESGDDIFFLTASPLAPQDQDSSFDVYDAHVCTTALPCQESSSVTSTSCESADECRPGAPTVTTFVAPPVAAGSGNATPNVAKPPSTSGKPPVKKLTNAQRLSKALKSCRKLPRKTKAQKKRRSKCEAQARHKYAPKKAKRAGKAKR